MSKRFRIVLGSALAAIPLGVVPVSEGTAQELPSFAVIAGQTLTNIGATTIGGNIAVSPGSSYTGNTTVTQTGAAYVGDAVATRIQNDLTTLYNLLAGRPTTSDLSGQGLGGLTLSPGVYSFTSSADLAADGILTLDAGGNPDAIFIFNIGSTLTAGSGSSVVLLNGAQGGNVFYRVGSSATLDTSAVLEGQIVALTDVTLRTTASITCGAAYARNGSVTLDSNTIQICTLAGGGFDTIVDNPLLTDNQNAVAMALSDYVADGGVLPAGFAILAATQTPEELAANLGQMSGEVATGVAPMGIQSMNAFLDAVVGSVPRPRRPVAAPRSQEAPFALVRENVDGAYTGKYGPEVRGSSKQPFAYPTTLTDQSHPWDLWASAYGSHNVTDGDASVGSQERTSQNRGLAVGLNFSPTAGKDLGVALSWNKADFTLSNGYGSGASDTVYVAVRGRTASERAYLEGALAFGRSDITTDRTVTIAGTDRLVGETTADTFAAHLEAGYHMGFFTPFAGVRAQSFTTKAYSETAAAGSSSYALQYDEHTTTSLRSELGVDMQWPTDNAGGGMPTIGLRAAWAHEFASNDPGTRSFLSVPGAPFTTTGATRDRDSLILAASAGIAASNGLYVSGAVNTEISRNSRDYGGSITVGYSW